MVNKTGLKRRVDTGTKRGSYNMKHDSRGKTHKENHLLKSFWSSHKMEDMIQLTPEQIDAEIAYWIEEFMETQLKRNPGWRWPTFLYDPKPKAKNSTRKINTSFNSRFV